MKKTPILFFTLFVIGFSGVKSTAQTNASGIRKTADIVIYNDPQFYSAFPSIVRRPDGELIVAFRRAPEWKSIAPQGHSMHVDPNSYLVSVRSKDDGKTWSKEPDLISAHPFGGSQDPCMVQLRDGSILCSSYGWSFVTPGVRDGLKKPIFAVGPGNQFVFMGGYLVRSMDGGNSWSKPTVSPPSKNEARFDLFGKPLPAYNRGAMCEGKDGRLFWVIAASTDATAIGRTSNHLMISDDKGATWNYSCLVAEDDKIAFNETSLYETPKGDLVAFMRTANFADNTCVARSTDGGKSFQKWKDAGFKGHPHYALRLPDNRVLLVYGYRHAPQGIRARILNAECTDMATAEEIILREDGDNNDIGYPWATMMGDKEALVVYYFNHANGTRHIAGTLLKID